MATTIKRATKRKVNQGTLPRVLSILRISLKDISEVYLNLVYTFLSMSENKERLITPEEQQSKPEVMVDLQSREPVNKEVDSWMKKIENEDAQIKTVNDAAGQPLLTPTTPVNPKIILPVTRQKFIAGFKKKMDEAGRWLSTFILRLIKVKDGDVEFKKDK